MGISSEFIKLYILFHLFEYFDFQIYDGFISDIDININIDKKIKNKTFLIVFECSP